jgi:hypothetical protein
MLLCTLSPVPCSLLRHNFPKLGLRILVGFNDRWYKHAEWAFLVTPVAGSNARSNRGGFRTQ